MKKFYSFFIAFVMVICAIFSLNFSNIPRSQANAASVEEAQAQFKKYAQSVLQDYKGFTKRLAGSDQEKEAADYIATKLGESGLTPKNNKFVENGYQEFKFMSIFTSSYEISQNIIYDYVGDESSKDMIVIGCHYDAVAYDFSAEDYLIESESIAGSASSVAMVLALAKFLPQLGLKFNIEFVFFGAGESNFAGSKFYTKGIGDENSQLPKDNILLMVNFDNIGVGKHVYFYTEEVSDSFSDQLSSVAESTNVLKFNPVHVSKTLLEVPNELGLKYSHVGMESDNFNFLVRRVKAVNFFAGDYESGLVLGRSEFGENELVLHTKNDNLEYITKTYGENCVINNLADCYTLIASEFTSENLLSVLKSAAGQTDWYYNIFANQKLVVYLTVFAFILLVVIAMIIHYRLTVKSYYSNIETEFLHTVIKICENVGADEEFNDEIPTEVSKKIADDIKKDKTIKTKRKKDEE